MCEVAEELFVPEILDKMFERNIQLTSFENNLNEFPLSNIEPNVEHKDL